VTLPPRSDTLAAVILVGGTAARLGGADKACLEVGGRTLLEHAIAATVDAAAVVVVGERRPTTRQVSWTREDPPGGGPAAGLLAGVDALGSEHDLVCALAVDMPRVEAATVTRLRDAVGDHDGAVLVDADGRRQPLAAVYRRTALERVRPPSREDERGLPLRRLLRDLALVEVAARGDEARDVDTWTDLRELG
jgi:molybdopterin-guanine dinucleotide biosynthesis protein A